MTFARAWCSTLHSCHHWFEDECSVECDEGKHDYPVNGCSCFPDLRSAHIK